MRQINIRQFLRNMREELLDLPITITRFKKPIATVIPPWVDDFPIDETENQSTAS